jgi:5-formyltetrahydrofolate cyclo-ligase
MIAPATDRSLLRAALRAKRKTFVSGLPQSVRNLAFSVLPSPVMALLPPGAQIALYKPVGGEVRTDAIALGLFDLGFQLSLPRLGGKAGDPHFMDFASWLPDDMLVPGPTRILQPDYATEAVIPDVVFTPLLGFDRALNRLGQGAGHYDRALETLPDALKIGLAWSVQMVDRLPVEPWDIPLDIVVTEISIFERNNG